MKALLVHQGAELYGSDRSFASSCKAFYELGIELTILLPEYGALVEEVERYGSVIIVDFGVLRKSALKKKPFTEIWRLARGYFYARSMLKEFDLIYVNTIVNLTFILALNKYRGLKYVHVREMPLGVVNKVFRRVLKYSGAKLIYNSFSVKDSSRITALIDHLSNIDSNIIKNSFMFDFYKNKKINETKIGFRFIFQSNDKTLTDIEINKEIKKITEVALSIDSVSLPGSS